MSTLEGIVSQTMLSHWGTIPSAPVGSVKTSRKSKSSRMFFLRFLMLYMEVILSYILFHQFLMFLVLTIFLYWNRWFSPARKSPATGKSETSWATEAFTTASHCFAEYPQMLRGDPMGMGFRSSAGLPGLPGLPGLRQRELSSGSKDSSISMVDQWTYSMSSMMLCQRWIFIEPTWMIGEYKNRLANAHDLRNVEREVQHVHCWAPNHQPEVPQRIGLHPTESISSPSSLQNLLFSSPSWWTRSPYSPWRPVQIPGGPGTTVQ